MEEMIKDFYRGKYYETIMEYSKLNTEIREINLSGRLYQGMVRKSAYKKEVKLAKLKKKIRFIEFMYPDFIEN